MRTVSIHRFVAGPKRWIHASLGTQCRHAGPVCGESRLQVGEHFNPVAKDALYALKAAWQVGVPAVLKQPNLTLPTLYKRHKSIVS